MCYRKKKDFVCATTWRWDYLFDRRTARALWFWESRTQLEPRLQGSPDGCDDCLEQKPPCAERRRHAFRCISERKWKCNNLTYNNHLSWPLMAAVDTAVMCNYRQHYQAIHKGSKGDPTAVDWSFLGCLSLRPDQYKTKGGKSAWRGSTLSNSGLKASHTVKLTAEPGLFLNVKKIHFLFLNIWIHKFNQFNDHIDAFVIILNITALKIIFIHMIFWCVAQWVSETLSWCISSVLSCMRVNVEVHNSKDSASSERIRLLVDGYFLPLCSCLFFCKAQLHTRRLNC